MQLQAFYINDIDYTLGLLIQVAICWNAAVPCQHAQYHTYWTVTIELCYIPQVTEHTLENTNQQMSITRNKHAINQTRSVVGSHSYSGNMGAGSKVIINCNSKVFTKCSTRQSMIINEEVPV